jgi:hypothetical protein
MEQGTWLGVCVWTLYFVVCIMVEVCVWFWVQEHCFALGKVSFEIRVQLPKQWFSGLSLAQLCNEHKM